MIEQGRSPRRRRRRAVGIVLALVVLAGLGVIAAGLGPDLPGPRLRDKLGLTKATKTPACRVEPGQDRTPSAPAPPAGRWRVERPLPSERDELRAATLAGRIYVVGGHTPSATLEKTRSLKLVESSDPADGSYRTESDLPIALDHAVVEPHGGFLYVTGGWSDNVPNNRMWRYSPATREWDEVAAMHVARGAPASAVIDDRLYVAGGVADVSAGKQAPTGALEVYDFKADRWTAGPQMPTPRHHTAAVALDGRLYVVGGRRVGDLSLDAFERYDPRTESWQKLAPLPGPSGGLGAAAVDGKLVALGGGDDIDRWMTRAVWTYDPESGRWRREPDMRSTRHGFGVAAAGRRVYVLGGSPCPGFGHTASVESAVLR